MTDDILVHHAELSYVDGEPHYVVAVQEGELYGENIPEGAVALTCHLLPADIFESRAAEYGIDPTTDEGWEDILHMVFVPVSDSRAIPEKIEDPDFLYNAPTIEHARKAHLRTIRKALGSRKLRGVPGVSEHRLLINEATRIAHSDAEDPIEFIKRTAPMSEEHIRVKQEYVRRHRHKVKARRLGLDPNRAYSPAELEQHAKRRAMKKDQAPTRESAEKLAIRLLGAPLDDVRGDRLPPRPGTPSKFLAQ